MKGADVSQSQVGKAESAEERSEETKSSVHTLKAATRSRYTPEEKIRIVLEGFRWEVTVNDLYRREGIKPHSYYAWTRRFMEAGKERLTGDSVRDATTREIHQLKRENDELKQLVAELSRAYWSRCNASLLNQRKVASPVLVGPT
jgi:transposase